VPAHGGRLPATIATVERFHPDPPRRAQQDVHVRGVYHLRLGVPRTSQLTSSGGCSNLMLRDPFRLRSSLQPKEVVLAGR
jgi:hypothetical protein